AKIAEAFLQDGLNRFGALSVRRLVVFDPPGALGYFQTMAAERYELIPQSEGDLGQRLHSFFAQEFERGPAAVVAIGTDSPTLPTSILIQAFDELERAHVVLGPATDGGYYLLGCTRLLPQIFDGVTWGTDAVLHQTVERLQNCHVRVALLPP